jgi:exonuclease III
MKIISWNVNGFRSRMNQSFLETFSTLDADVYCLQETRLQAGEGGIDVPGYATIIVLILFLGGMQLFCLGILGEYLAKV